MKDLVSTCFLIALTIGAAGPVRGQDNKDEIIQKLLVRLEALEREVAALKGAQAPVAVREPSPAVEAKSQERLPVESVEPEPRDSGRFTFHGYADAGFLRNEDGRSTKRFAVGELDFFAKARISSNLSALVETVIETNNQLHVAQVPINVERLLLQYRHNDYFSVDAGSYRTAIGYYNTAYLRGSWLQTALSRPKLFTFEDDGGFLPLHNTGISAGGKLPSGALDLHYVVEAGSSRNYAQPGRIGLEFEQNRAINAALSARPRGIPGLQLGFSSYHDTFSPAETFAFQRAVWTAHVVYQNNRLEILNEGALAKFRSPSGEYATIPAYYSQLAYRVAPGWRPYFRFENMNARGTGQLAVARQYVPWRRLWLGGLRYDLTEAVALKFELGKETDWFRPSWIKAAMQVAFTF